MTVPLQPPTVVHGLPRSMGSGAALQLPSHWMVPALQPPADAQPLPVLGGQVSTTSAEVSERSLSVPSPPESTLASSRPRSSSAVPLESIAQLAIYALALTRLVPGLKLFDIKCSWFNEHEYCEFFPRTLFARQQ